MKTQLFSVNDKLAVTVNVKGKLTKNGIKMLCNFYFLIKYILHQGRQDFSLTQGTVTTQLILHFNSTYIKDMQLFFTWPVLNKESKIKW